MKMSHIESEGHRMYSLKRYKDALRFYRLVMKKNTDVSVAVYVNSNESISAILDKLSKKDNWEFLYEELIQEQEVILERGLNSFPEEANLWAPLSVVHLIHRKKEEFFKAAYKTVSLADGLSTGTVGYILSAAFFLGDLEICVKAMPKYLRYHKAYRTTQSNNPLAELLAVFGPMLCSEFMMKAMLSDWYPNGYWYTDPDNRQLVDEFCSVALFRRADVRERTLQLPDFDCPYLNKVVVIFKVIVNYFNKDMVAVKDLFSESLPEDESMSLPWLLKMAKEIAYYESDKGRFDLDFKEWVPDLQPKEDFEAGQDATLKNFERKYEEFLLAIASGRYVEASDLKNGVTLVLSSTENGSDQTSWDRANKCLAKGDAIGAINILRAHLRKEGGTPGNFSGSAERDILFACLYSQQRLVEARAVIAEMDESHPLHEEIKKALDFEIPKEDEEALARQDQALENFDGLRAYLKQYPHDLLAIVKKYIRDPRRCRERDTVAHFIHYLILHEAQYLGDGDMDEGMKYLFTLLPKNRKIVRKEIGQKSSHEDFERVWNIILTLRRIEMVLTVGCLSEAFNASLNSDVDFALDLAKELISHDWCKNNKLATQYRKLLLWPTLEKLGVQHYSHLFSSGNTSSKDSSKQKRKAKLEDRHIADVVESLAEPKGFVELGEWKFFVAKTPDHEGQPINPTSEAFNEYFADALINVSGAGILHKLEYLLGFDVYQRVMYPRLKIGLYPGYHNMKLGRIRIFWEINDTAKEIHFAVLNRRDAY